MRRIIHFRERYAIGFEKMRENRPEIKYRVRRANSREIIKPPDHAGRAEISARIAIGGEVVLWVSRPEVLLVKMRQRIANDVRDGGFGPFWFPG